MIEKIKTVLLMVICAALCMGAAVTSSPYTGAGWNTGAPNDEALIGNSYQELQDLRKGVELRCNREHLAFASSSVGGWHLNGSAVCYEGTTAEPNLPDDSAALSNIARDRGRLWIDDNFNPPVLKRWDGTAYEIIATLASGSAPKVYLISDANENTDGGRESKIIFKGEKADDTLHELGMIQVSHDGSGDDKKGDIILFVNDGTDTDGALTEVARIDSAKLATFAGAVTVTGALTPSDALTMASGKTATIENIQAVDSTGILLKSDSGDTVITVEDSNTATLADSSQLATSAAPTADADLVNKKYADDQIAAATIADQNTHSADITLTTTYQTVATISSFAAGGDDILVTATAPFSGTATHVVYLAIYIDGNLKTEIGHSVTGAGYQSACATWLEKSQAGTIDIVIKAKEHTGHTGIMEGGDEPAVVNVIKLPSSS